MQTRSTVLPPGIVHSQARVYANQGDIYALEASSGTLLQSYSIQGLGHPTVVNDVLYINVSRHPDYTIQALRSSDGAPLWSYKVEGRLSGAPIVAGGVVFISITEGTIYALQASDGKLLWQYTIDLGPGVPSFLGPILFASPTVAGKVVYISPAVNSPLKPFVYALQAKDGALLWKSQISDSTSFPLIFADGVIYISTHSNFSALHASDGSPIWQHEISDQTRSSPVVLDGIVYISLSQFKHEVLSFESMQYKAFLCALRASDGSLLWQQQLGVATGASNPTIPAATHGAVYVGADDGYLYALRTADGSPLWQYKTGGTLLSSPILVHDIVYVGSNDGYVYALSADDGALLWQTFVSVAVTATASYSSMSLKRKNREK